jgi:ubiquinone/menaquinone biosynthesis C-methylase UbiE
MSENTKKSISDSLEADHILLPHLPFLLQDLWALGSSVEYIVYLAGSMGLSAGEASILDLGCGKGAVAIQIAFKLGFQVTGIDAMESFLKDARHKADEYKVSQLVNFINRDILEYVLETHNFHVVILASLGGIFGNWQNTVSVLRRQVRTGGFMIIDDGFLREKNKIDRKGYGHYRNHDETVKALTSLGDKLIQEINTTDLSIKINEEYLKCMNHRAGELIETHPEIKNEINRYLKVQSEECQIIGSHIEGALWLLQKQQ